MVFNKYRPYLIIFSIAATVYGLIYIFSADFCVTAPNHYNSYSRQAAAWLSGRLDLGENVPWLELAVFQGRYYVMFAPFPSIIMLPFVLFFGINTPDNAIALCVALLSLFYAYKLAYKVLGNQNYAIILSLLLIIGSNYLHIALWGAVWYIAQNMAFLLTLMAFYYALTDKKRNSYISLLAMCAAMGCRPFNIIYLPVLMYLLYMREGVPITAYIKKILVYSIPAVVLGSFFTWLNYARFGNIFEFGRNYLAEFVNDPHGQFYVGRILGHLKIMLFGFDITRFPMFSGFAFWVASPLVVSFVICLLLYVYKRITGGIEDNDSDRHDKYIIFSLFFLAMIHIVAISMHTTLGGHQFGSRYTVDTLAAFYLGLLLILKNLPHSKAIYLNIVPLLAGLTINFYGTVKYLSFYYG